MQVNILETKHAVRTDYQNATNVVDGMQTKAEDKNLTRMAWRINSCMKVFVYDEEENTNAITHIAEKTCLHDNIPQYKHMVDGMNTSAADNKSVDNDMSN